MSAPLPTLSSRWLEYDLRILPRGCSDAQRTETRRAFYAGANAVFDMLIAISGRVDTDTQNEDDEKILERLGEEFIAFARDIQRGRA